MAGKGFLAIKTSWSGAKEMIAKLKAIKVDHSDKAAKALYIEAQIEMTESKKRCPVGETGNLRASGTVHLPERHGRTLSVTLSYGGAAKDYAVVQHERLDYFHKVGQAKYLESVLNESRPFMAQRLAARMGLGAKSDANASPISEEPEE